jgi:hypothetical protein
VGLDRTGISASLCNLNGSDSTLHLTALRVDLGSGRAELLGEQPSQVAMCWLPR